MAKVYTHMTMSVDGYIADPDDGKGALVAWDPVRQAPRWKVRHDGLWNGGALATAGGLVFQGDADQAVRELIQLAIRNGGPDNITCIVADAVDSVDGPVPPSTG